MAHMPRNNRPALAERKARAEVRQALADKRIPQEQLERLERFGPDGAIKERAKLAARIAKGASAKPAAQPAPQKASKAS